MEGLCLFLLFGFWFLEVDFLCIIIAIFFIRVELVATHIAKEIVGGLREDLVGNEHTNLYTLSQSAGTMWYFFNAHVERVGLNLKEIEEATRLGR